MKHNSNICQQPITYIIHTCILTVVTSEINLNITTRLEVGGLDWWHLEHRHKVQLTVSSKLEKKWFHKYTIIICHREWRIQVKYRHSIPKKRKSVKREMLFKWLAPCWSIVKFVMWNWLVGVLVDLTAEFEQVLQWEKLSWDFLANYYVTSIIVQYEFSGMTLNLQIWAPYTVAECNKDLIPMKSTI